MEPNAARRGRPPRLPAPVVVFAGPGPVERATVEVDARPEAMAEAFRRLYEGGLVRVLGSEGRN